MNTLRKHFFRAAVVTLAVTCLAMPAALAQDEDEIVAVPVTITEVLSTEVSPIVPAAGTVFSRNETQITAGMAGRLDWVAEPGDIVTAGDTVARFDCELLGLQHERQVAEADRAGVTFQNLQRETARLESLIATNAVSELQLERTQASRDLARGNQRIAKIVIRETEGQLKRCTVRAPFSGVVTLRLRNPGEDVERSTVLAAMTDPSNLEVRASVPIRYLPRMITGEVAEVRMNNLRMEGLVRTVVPAANSQSQTFQVRLDLPQGAPQIVAAGQLVSVSLPLSANAALTVPRDSVVLREDGAFVMRINHEQKVERVLVEVTEATGDNLAVRGAIASGDRIAVRGAESLEEGELVAIQTEI
jgi:RND family efflux transporter MFP subunit